MSVAAAAEERQSQAESIIAATVTAITAILFLPFMVRGEWVRAT
jgi:hypothetical protein